jgi:lipopolysaccharide transport system permease protein
MPEALTQTVVIVPGKRPPAGAALTGRAAIDWWLVIWRNRSLLSALVRRDINSRYRGSVLGIAWLVGIPLVMMATYTFLFVGVLKVSFDGGKNPWVGALSIWCGMLFWQSLSESLARSSSVLFDNAPFVKRIPFPIEILPAMPVLTAGVGAGTSVCLFALAHLIVLGLPPATWLLAPLVVGPLALIALGACWALASVGAYLRDLKHVVPLGMTVLMFLTPIVYPASAVPAGYRWAIDINPLATVFPNIRAIAVEGRVPPIAEMLSMLALGFACAACGYALFRSREAEYSDVI